MLSLLTLVSSALSLYGVSEIYKGKKSESDKKTTWGILMFGFLNTKKDSEPVIVEIQNEQKNNQQVAENVDTIDAVGRSTPIPVEFLQDAKSKVAIAKSKFINFR